MKAGRRKITGKTILIGAVLLFLVAAAVIVFLWDSPASNYGEEDHVSQEELGKVRYEGKLYQYNENVSTILFMGIDNDDRIMDQDIPGMAGQTDVLMLLAFDEETKEAHIVQIPRDTITEIDLYDDKGELYDRKSMQVALQYAYTTGGETGCWAVKKTVSELLYDLYIDNFIAMDIAAIPILNDAVGPVAIFLKEDYTDIDPSFVKGAEVSLTGQLAKKFIRYRDTEEAFSNQDRMDRQVQYIPALLTAVRNAMAEEQGDYSVFYDKISEYLVTDMKEDQMNFFGEYDLTEAHMEQLPGTWQEGEEHDEFHVDEKALEKMLIELFYVLDK